MTLVLVSGTGTDVGKTVVTAALASLAAAQGQRVAIVKPVQTGLAPQGAGDLADVRRLSGVTDLHEFYRYPDPLSPEAAARRIGLAGPRVSDLVDQMQGVQPGRDLVLVEGAGGLLVRLNAQGETFADLAQALGAPVLIVTRPDLGTLNHTALTIEGLQTRKLTCQGLVVGSWPKHPDLACRENLIDLGGLPDAPLLGLVPDGAGRLTPSEFTQLSRSALAPALGGLFDLPATMSVLSS